MSLRLSARTRRLCAALTGAAVLATTGLATASAASAAPGSETEFVQRSGTDLTIGGEEFRFAGTNNYYLHYKSPLMRDAVLEKASDAGFDVVRTWGWFDIGNEDGSNSVAGIQDGTYFQYWDPEAGKPAYNDGPSGLERLDAVVAKAGEEGLRLVIPFTNNWQDFGGMDQYVRWAGQDHHDDFYTDPQIRQWYKDWVSHVLNRTNTITGVQYKDDPTIMTWELANEPRCVGSGGYPRSDSCTTDTLTAWADEMSTHIKSIDTNHLVSMGDEGFFCVPGVRNDEQYDCSSGVDTVRFAALPNMDVMSYHIYPDAWGKDARWGLQYIKDHSAAAKQIGKPVTLGEFGYEDEATRNVVYQQWTNAVASTGGNGALYWILSDVQDDGTLYPDYDGHTVYCPSPVCTTLSNFAERMRSGQTDFPPVADHDSTGVEFGESAELWVTMNDTGYSGARVVSSTIDLDPAAAGIQRNLTTPAGAWRAPSNGGGRVSFTPAEGFSGRATASYVARDTAGRHTNAATITITVRPQPGAAVTLFDFEDGVQGWAGASFESDPGTTTTQTSFVTGGSQGLQVDSNNKWFESTFAAPQDFTGKTTVSFDMQNPGRSVSFVLRTGPGFDWCQVNGAPSETEPNTVEVDLTAATCGGGFTDVRAMNIFFSAGTSYIDTIRVS